MIGPSNRVPGAHAPQIETALAFTARGQAIWADPTIPHPCSECAHRGPQRPAQIMGQCREYAARMQGRRGQPIDKRQQACGAFQFAGKGAAP
jgi:hypothetical protein